MLQYGLEVLDRQGDVLIGFRSVRQIDRQRDVVVGFRSVRQIDRCFNRFQKCQIDRQMLQQGLEVLDRQIDVVVGFRSVRQIDRCFNRFQKCQIDREMLQQVQKCQIDREMLQQVLEVFNTMHIAYTQIIERQIDFLVCIAFIQIGRQL